MASQRTVSGILRRAGYDPIEGRAIIVTYAAHDLSDRIARFFCNEFYVLQLCRHSVVLLPFSKLTLSLRREVALEIPLCEIRKVTVQEDGLNWRINLDTVNGRISLSAQQKELSEFRSSGALATGLGWLNTGFLGAKSLAGDNWHRDNLDDTLRDLQAL